MYEFNGIKVYTAAEIPKPDTSYFLPWRLDMLYEIEPELRIIAERTVANKRRRYPEKLDAYSKAKDDTWELVGLGARDPRLRSSGAYDCFFDYILDELNI